MEECARDRTDEERLSLDFVLLVFYCYYCYYQSYLAEVETGGAAAAVPSPPSHSLYNAVVALSSCILYAILVCFFYFHFNFFPFL